MAKKKSQTFSPSSKASIPVSLPIQQHHLFQTYFHIHDINITTSGIEPNVRDFEGDTALSHACCCGSLGVARLLVAKRSEEGAVAVENRGLEDGGPEGQFAEGPAGVHVAKTDGGFEGGEVSVRGSEEELNLHAANNSDEGNVSGSSRQRGGGGRHIGVESVQEVVNPMSIDRTFVNMADINMEDLVGDEEYLKSKATQTIDSRTQDSVHNDNNDMDQMAIKLKVTNRCTDINTGDLDGVTPLHKAIANNWGDIVDLLLEQPQLKVIGQDYQVYQKL